MAEKSLPRRVLLRLGGALGLVATGVAVTGRAEAMSPVDRPAPPGAFGRPAPEPPRAGALDGTSVIDVRPGNVAKPGHISASGDRLLPSTGFVDRTPLSRREKWEVTG